MDISTEFKMSLMHKKYNTNRPRIRTSHGSSDVRMADYEHNHGCILEGVDISNVLHRDLAHSSFKLESRTDLD